MTSKLPPLPAGYTLADTNEGTSVARALSAIANALEGLSAEEARRVIRAVAILHGIELEDD